jgi:branched-chain amino acid transport system permease protein
MYAKLTAFAVSSFIIGVSGALWGFVYLGAWEPAAFSVEMSFRLLFMVIIGGMGSIMGSFFGASFIVGVAGALWAFVYLGAWEPAAFSVDISFRLLFMVIIGGLGSILGGFLGAAFITLLPIALSQILPSLAGFVGLEISTAGVSHTELMIFGGLIVWFLIVEPHGLAKLWAIAKQKLRLWPFPH